MARIPIPTQEHHPCIACGHDNPAGLHMEFAAEDQVVISELCLPDHMCGWRGVAHGGVVSMVLDEVMGNAAIYLLRRIVLTRSMTVTFHRAVGIGTPIRAEAELAERPDERRAIMTARLLDPEGQILAEADGDYAVFTAAAARRVGLNEEMIADFEQHMQRLGPAE